MIDKLLLSLYMQKKKLYIILPAMLLVFTGLFLIFKTNKIKDLPDIMKEGRMSVLIESGTSGFTKDSTSVYGFQYEIIRKFADTIGVELVVINEGDERKGFDELTGGNCEVLVSLMPVSSDSTMEVSFLHPIVTTRLMLMQLKDSVGMIPVDKQYLLDGKKLTVRKNSPFIPRINDLSEELAIKINIEEKSFNSLDELALSVVNGKEKYAVCEEYLADGLLSKNPELDITVPLSFHQELSWCVSSRSKKLHEKLNNFLNEFVGSMEYWQLYYQYYPKK